jgi:protein Mpv17
LTNMVTSAGLWVVGDLIAQTLSPATDENGKPVENYDFVRTARMASWGGLGFAPLAHPWYQFLQRAFPSSSVQHVASKVLLDQSIWAAGVTSLLFTYTSLMEGKSLEQAKSKIQDSLLPTLKVNWLIWPLVQVVNLSIVPPNFRLLVINTVAVPWAAYLAIVSNTAVRGHDPLVETRAK